MDILAIIPARKGSKGIPDKNIKLLAGHPLIAWSIAASRASQYTIRTVVSTDSEDIAKIATQYGAEVPSLRPKELAEDSSQTEPALLHMLSVLQETESYIPDAVLLLQPTSPIRFRSSIDAVIKTYTEGEYDSALSVFEGHHFKWKNPQQAEALYDYKKRPLRQELTAENRLYSETGSMYIVRTSILQATHNRLGGTIGLYETDLLENIDIDTLDDFRLAELIANEWSGRLTIPK